MSDESDEFHRCNPSSSSHTDCSSTSKGTRRSSSSSKGKTTQNEPLGERELSLRTMGENALKRGNVKEAIALFSSALQCNKDSPSLLCCRGIALLHDGNIEAALQDGLTAVQLKPSYSKAYYCLGNALIAMGRKHDYVRAFQVCRKLEPSNDNYRLALSKAQRTAKTFLQDQDIPFGAIPLPCACAPIECRFVVNVHADGSILTTEDVLDGISVSRDGRFLEIRRDVSFVETWTFLSSSKRSFSLDPSYAEKRPKIEQWLGSASFVRVELTLQGLYEGLLALYWLPSGQFCGWHVEWKDYESMFWSKEEAVLQGWCHANDMEGISLQSKVSHGILHSLPMRLSPMRTHSDFSDFVKISSTGYEIFVSEDVESSFIREGFKILQRVRHVQREICPWQHRGGGIDDDAMSAYYSPIHHNSDALFTLSHSSERSSMDDIESHSDDIFAHESDEDDFNVSGEFPMPTPDSRTMISPSSYILPTDFEAPFTPVLPPIRIPKKGDVPLIRRELVMIAAHCGKSGVFCCTWNGDGEFMGAAT
eukprot:TRINITY_DN1908_c0_g2_i1.p1 TRINITY_DN1908_c0_g2~~TRINITY_DN1908_c0_g2_i1.p1  ORF type:complete len:535 (+),score=117.86 TRINITY_DN1908_c0_g2_i1:221-1825(+)